MGIYRGDVAERLPAGVPAEAAAAARDTLGGAVAVAQELPGELGTAVIDVAQRRVRARHAGRLDHRRRARGRARDLAVVMLRNVGSGEDREAEAEASAGGGAEADARRIAAKATSNDGSAGRPPSCYDA